MPQHDDAAGGCHALGCQRAPLSGAASGAPPQHEDALAAAEAALVEPVAGAVPFGAVAVDVAFACAEACVPPQQLSAVP